ncbi:Protein of unknown function [Anaplasma phagocytophilum]|uniref:Uncharacterized protein n=1 Tax=Anaplasma phagocytophilum TaxID=948 RepID=A0A098EF23_ANAPH|nr:Protein of unknown function [Anaplasma phagocytophilum]
MSVGNLGLGSLFKVVLCSYPA